MTVKDTARQTEVYNDVLTFDQAFIGSLAVTTAGTYNPVTEVTTGATTTNHTAACVFVKASKGESIPDNYVITEPKNKIIVSALKGVVPSKNDVYTLLGTAYTILGVIESSAGDDSLFRVYLKEGA